MNPPEAADECCPICKGLTKQISRKKLIYPNAGHGWENDSTMDLAYLSKAIVYARFCTSCFHTIRLPKFNTENLYSSEATAVRAKHFAHYFPDKSYGETANKIDIGKAFLGASIENKRFSFISSKINAFLKNTQLDSNIIKILDWGGGDGSVSEQYTSILTYVTGCKTKNWVFDYAPWKHGNDTNRLSSKTIRSQAPFDIVILSHVLEHTDDPVKMISDISQVLNIGGILIIEVPDERMNILRALLGKTITLHYHVAWYSRRSLAVLLRQCGLGRWKTYYHFKSSYHGSPMTTILAIAQKPPNSNKDQGIYPSIFIEIYGLIIFAIKKIISKFVH